MIDNIFDKTTIGIMGKVLDTVSTRQKFLSANIANSMTPGYQRQEVDFAATLNRAVAEKKLDPIISDERHIQSAEKEKQNNSNVVVKKGGEINVEEEMAVSAENQLVYSTAAKILGGNFNSLKIAIRGRI